MATNVPPDNKPEGAGHSAGRRLEFGSKQFKGKTFFMDINGYPREREIKEELVSRGATIQDYLDKKVRYLVTTRDTEQINKAKEAYASSGQSPTTPSTGGQSQLFSPTTCSNRSPVEQKVPPYPYHTRRGYKMLQIAQGNSRARKPDILVTACSWKCKIIPVKEVEKELRRLKPLSRKGDSGMLCNKSDCKVWQLRVPFFKAVDNCCEYRPITFEPKQWPVFNPSCPVNCCPFDLLQPGDTDVQLHKDVDKRVTEKCEYEKRPGFCECCNTRYEDLTKHLSGSQHQKYANNEDNYLTLDKLISQVPSLDDVIAAIKAQELESMAPMKSPRNLDDYHCEEGQGTCVLPRPTCTCTSDPPLDGGCFPACNFEKEEVVLASLPSSVHPNSEMHTSENITKLSPSASKVHSMSTTNCEPLPCKVRSPKHSLCSPVRMELCLTKIKSPSKTGQLTPVRKRRMQSLLSENLAKRLCHSEVSEL